jgi:hypothetical protein
VALTRKGVPWLWRSDIEGAALRTLKQAVLSSPMLAAPDPSKPFHVVTDASDYAVGASLEQVHGGGGGASACGLLFSLLESCRAKVPCS